MDLWDVFRMGGALDSFRLVGTVPVAAGAFSDNYNDTAVAEAEVLEFDNLQPWPTLDLPLNVPTGVTVNGTIVQFPTAGLGAQAANLPRYLPGNLVRLNQTVYTLFDRPTVAAGTCTMALVENADVAAADSLFIYEPLMAAQPLPFLWGPSAEGGVIFGCGDPNRPGTVCFAKNFNPDSAPDRYNLELSPPSEPLTGGLLHAGESLVCSNAHWWALRPSFGGVNKWSARLLPIAAGGVSHFAVCSDGQTFYFVGKDGVYSSSKGLLTTRDNIYSLFPHEGTAGAAQVVLGVTVPPPEYESAQDFRLACANGFLYFDYPDDRGILNHLVYDLHGEAWYVDTFAGANLTMHYAVPQQDPTAETFVLAGDASGNVLVEQARHDDNGSALVCRVVTREANPGGWAYAWFENPGLDLLPTSDTALFAQGVSLGAPLGALSMFQSVSRVTQAIVDIDGGRPLKSLGLDIRWTQTYERGETDPVTLYMMQWLAVAYPEPVLNQRTKGTSHGLRGFQHLYMGQLAYVSTAPVLITLNYDQPGGSGNGVTLVLPATAAPHSPDPVKQNFKIPPNKWKIVSYDVACIVPFFLWPEDCEMWVKEWGSEGEYTVVRPWGGAEGGPIA